VLISMPTAIYPSVFDMIFNVYFGFFIVLVLAINTFLYPAIMMLIIVKITKQFDLVSS
jgi:hypothetical protein